jgi:GrpB-like predicted nucleotidyltransferase (UPF0157 family)
LAVGAGTELDHPTRLLRAIGSQAPSPSLIPREPADQILLAEPDLGWADAYAVEETRIRTAVGAAGIQVHHVGSTSVPGLAAKPIIDIVLLVGDSTDEQSYVPALQVAGYQFHLREPGWHEHRLFKRRTQYSSRQPRDQGGETKVNLHVFTAGSSEARRMLIFRDWLRAHPADRELYQETKRHLAGRQWAYVQDYADAKSTIVHEIMQRALFELD